MATKWRARCEARRCRSMRLHCHRARRASRWEPHRKSMTGWSSAGPSGVIRSWHLGEGANWRTRRPGKNFPGWGEVIKHARIAEGDLRPFLEKNRERFLRLEPEP